MGDEGGGSENDDVSFLRTVTLFIIPFNYHLVNYNSSIVLLFTIHSLNYALSYYSYCMQTYKGKSIQVERTRKKKKLFENPQNDTNWN